MESFPKMLLSGGYALATIVAMPVYLNYGLSASVLTVWLGGAVLVVLMAVGDFALRRFRGSRKVARPTGTPEALIRTRRSVAVPAQHRI